MFGGREDKLQRAWELALYVVTLPEDYLHYKMFYFPKKVALVNL
jgi:hypothetical protein